MDPTEAQGIIDAIKAGKAMTDEQSNNLLHVLTRAGPQSPPQGVPGLAELIQALTTQQSVQLEKWKGRYAVAKNSWEAAATNYRDKDASLEKMKKSFSDKAKAGELSPQEVMVGLYLLFPDDEWQGKARLYELLYRKPKHRVVEDHNWYVFHTWDEATKATWGPYIEDLEFPLFPGELDALNSTILGASGPAPLRGGGRRPKKIEEYYRLDGVDQLVGGYTEAVKDATGTQVLEVDMSNTEDALRILHEQLRNVERQIASVKAAQAAAAKKAPQAQRPRQASASQPARARAIFGRGPAEEGAKNADPLEE